MIDNLFRRERLSQKSRNAGFHQTIEAIASNETGAKNDWYIGSNFAQPMKGFFAVHEGHRQIEQNQLERLRLPPKEIERFKSRLRGHDVAT